MHRFAVIVFSVLAVGHPIYGAAQTPAPANEVLDKFKDWVGCTQTAAAALEPSGGTPEEIAIAAAERCKDPEVQYFVAEMFGPRPIPQDELKAHAEGVRATIRNKAIATVIEIRAARARSRAH